MTAELNGIQVRAGTITMPIIGAWHAALTLAGETELSGDISLIVDGEAFRGSVVGPTRPFAGKTQLRVVGGKGDLSRELEPKNYTSSPSVRTIVLDTIGKEKLSGTADVAILGASLPAWQRVQGLASHNLTRVLRRVGATWRVLADGTIWVGQDTFPEVSPEHTVEDEDWTTGAMTVATAAPVLRPGVTFRGQKAQEVAHSFSPKMLRTEVLTVSLGGVLSSILDQIRREVDYTKRYRATVVRVNGDKTVQLAPDDVRIAGPGMDNVRVRSGVPGVITPIPGAACLVGFDNGDPSIPYAEGWDGADVATVQLADGKVPAAGIGSTVSFFFPPSMLISGLLGVPPATTPFSGTLQIPSPGVGVIQSGNPKVIV